METLTKTELFYGHYLIKNIKCPNCLYDIHIPEEKMTDVNIASEMIIDTFNDNFDTAILISGDSDLVRPLQIIKDLNPLKRIVIAFPPARFSSDLKNYAHAYFMIGRAKLARSQFSERVTSNMGYILCRPNEWT